MRRLIATLIVLAALVCVARAEPWAERVAVTMGTATTATNTITDVVGWVESILVSVSDGASTGTVTIAYLPNDGVSAAVSIATGATTDEKLWRPRVDGTTVAGVANTNDPPERFLLMRETVRMVVAGSPTGKVWTATLKMEK